MKKTIKKLAMMMAAMVLAVSLTACGGKAKAVSDKKIQEIQDAMGIQGAESVLDNVTLEGYFSSKISSKDYKDDPEYTSIWKELSELCGEEKKYDYYGCYGLGEDQEQAQAMREEYKSYLQEQGYEYQGTNAVFGDIYVKGGYAVMVKELIGPVSWSDKTTGQYGVYVWFY